jgi:hypothetical protein
MLGVGRGRDRAMAAPMMGSYARPEAAMAVGRHDGGARLLVTAQAACAELFGTELQIRRIGST